MRVLRQHSIVQNCSGVKLWQINRFRVLVWNIFNVGKFIRLTLAIYMNLEFGLVKYWQMTFVLPKFSPARILCYKVITNQWFEQWLAIANQEVPGLGSHVLIVSLVEELH